MPPMKNIYNLISDGFEAMGNREGIETDYIIDVEYIQGPFRSYDITIQSKNQNSAGLASLVLLLDNSGNLLDYQDTNTLFINSNWDRFCLLIEAQISLPDPLDTLQGYILEYANDVNDNVEEDPYET